MKVAECVSALVGGRVVSCRCQWSLCWSASTTYRDFLNTKSPVTPTHPTLMNQLTGISQPNRRLQ